MKQDTNLKARIFKNNMLYIVVCVLSALTAIPLLAILGEVLIKGWEQLGWSFLTEATPNAYKAMMAMQNGEPVPGGIANGIVGTFLMLLLASVIAIPVWYLSVGVSRQLVCYDCQLSDRLVTGYSFNYYRYHYVYLGCCAHERIFRFCR